MTNTNMKQKKKKKRGKLENYPGILIICIKRSNEKVSQSMISQEMYSYSVTRVK